MVLEIKTPKGYITTEHPSQRTHSCDLKSMLQPGIDDIWNSLTGLKLGNYKT